MLTKEKMQAARRILDEMFKNSKELAELNINLELGNGRYGNETGTFKLNVISMQNGKVVPKEEIDFKNECYRFGLEKEHLGQKFMCQGEEFEICGLKPRSYKRPILAKTKTGKTYKFAPYTVKQSLGIKEEIGKLTLKRIIGD